LITRSIHKYTYANPFLQLQIPILSAETCLRAIPVGFCSAFG